MTPVRLALLTLMLLDLPACLSRDSRPAQYAELRHRVAFDLRCEETDIKVTPLHENESSSCTTDFHAAQVAGVSCHDRRATYVWAQTEQRGGAWVLDSDSHPEK